MVAYLVRAAPRLVEAWSIARLPFEPAGWQLALRSEVRAAVRQLRVESWESLYRVYGSGDRARCDVENALFYNVGVSAFAGAMRQGVRFERSFSSIPHESLRDATHHYRYKPTDPDADFRWWRRGETLRRWATTRWPSASSASGWWHVFSDTNAGAGSDVVWSAPFGVEVVLDAPAGFAIPIHERIKPLLDGLIAACHRHAGSNLEIVAERLAAALGVDSRQIVARLVSPVGAVLGPRLVALEKLRAVEPRRSSMCCRKCARTSHPWQRPTSGDCRGIRGRLEQYQGTRIGPVDYPVKLAGAGVAASVVCEGRIGDNGGHERE